ncbi:MAG: sigma-70 family RNA polymerase sigma factor [Muribaculaceae bacterium]|nr:sigma-70 family RNA polymerase sigma factor [Muribaculaceae bacterium]
MNTVTMEKELLSIRPGLYDYARQLTLCVEDAEDLVQETMYKVLKNAKMFVSENNFKGWAYTILKNIFINDYRKNAKRRQINDVTPNDYFLNLTNVYTQETPDMVLSVKEIDSVIAQFSDELRVPFKYYLNGYPYQEIADKLSIPLGTVKSRIFFARKKLQKLLKDYRE